jgi:YebC/PmpR family DNA-binding regulatory protein
LSGHSKWAQIKRQKAVNDKARGRLFSKLAREISVSAREAGKEPDFNPRLRTAIANAKAENMPGDNIERAILRGIGALPGVSYQSLTYEGYGPGGAALYMECLTDNAKRTVAEIRHILEKGGGNLGRDGSVAWMFERKGQVYIDAGRYDEDMVFDAALDAGAKDVERDDELFVVSTAPEDFHSVQDALRQRGVEIQEAELAMMPASTMQVAGREAEKLLQLVSRLQDQDDVQRIFFNFEVDEQAWEALSAS